MKHLSLASLCAVFLLTSCSLIQSPEPTTTTLEPTWTVTETVPNTTIQTVEQPTVQIPVNSTTPAPTAVPATTPPPAPSSAVKTYTMAEVSQHSTSTDCWLILSNGVYDVTPYISRHPGGNAILKWCGRDATQMFSKHPASAKELKEQFKIGELAQ